MPINFDNYSIKFLYLVNSLTSIYIIGYSNKINKYFRIDITFDEFINHNSTDEFYFQVVTNGRYYIIKTELLDYLPDYVQHWDKINFNDNNFPNVQYNIPNTIYCIILGLVSNNHIII